MATPGTPHGFWGVLGTSVVKNPAPHLPHTHPTIKRVEKLDRFLQRVLSKDRAQRPKDAVTFFKEFEHALFVLAGEGEADGEPLAADTLYYLAPGHHYAGPWVAIYRL